MNAIFSKLNEIANKDERLIIGLMSGTSLDGLDIALVQIRGFGENTSVKLLAFETVDYSDELRGRLKRVCFNKNVDLESICLINKYLGVLYAKWLNAFLTKYNYRAEAIDLIASHGQTIYHSPAKSRINDEIGNATLQIVDADQIAVHTGIITLSDFRQKNIAQGEEGAPLALYGDYLLFKNNAENRILLNIGGIANFTLLPKNTGFNSVLSTDVGPGNTIMNQYVQANFKGLSFDEDAKIALNGVFHQNLVDQLMSHSFFSENFPKTTGPEVFNLTYLEQALSKLGMSLSKEDVLASLNRFTATGIAFAVKKYFSKEDEPVIYLSGGGTHNPLLIKNLKELIPYAVLKNTSDLGLDADAKEAILFALLANETIAGDYKIFNSKTLSMGKISLPY
ncbi:anhydro-N-acetylmuramic acid kinase [Pelobium sp.]|nr:anhydro-N-acetylmuramic acid kinase [Pelobium sp.]MDA9554696.1 anhydro-N-acetylmuramic acid kinase [Pelobium sp.]